ncbi:M20/M25/M40 family metallo-hydrolase [Belliella sp. R4-6]|uniref:M20/M25/M40 family metallo-hydrolase n=1 Tax=Belliella alkalica TaxID=1730871 RepID=A0ABS9VF53_9BACT|nr:M20/M25/M40 family metallo-hydrolase [Belliella alkalica]MCH7414565.1 M20/M25/M40 family metallo-hydrolase [Belliella alkalica]
MINRLILLSALMCIVAFSSLAQQTPLQRLEKHVYVLSADSLEGRGLGTEGRLKAISYIENEMRQMGLMPVFEDDFIQEFLYRSELINVDGKNIVGMIPGTDPVLKDEYIVVGAHYDHLGYTVDSEGNKIVFSGADDNASGVAGVLEIAREILSGEEKPKRSLIFVAFDAEESGLIGSSKFVELDKPFPNDAIKAMFSLDMIGMLSTVKHLDLKGLETLAESQTYLVAAQIRNNLSVKNTSPNIERRTDTWPFGKLGIPAIHVHTGLKSPYHKPGDNPELLDYDGMAQISLFLSGLLLEMGNAEVLAPVSKFDSKKVLYGEALKFGVHLGMGSSHHRHEEDFYRAFGLFSIEAGLYGKLRISRKFELAVSTLYDIHGSVVEDGKLRRHSLTIPALVRFNIAQDEDGSFRFFTGVGPYYRHHLRQRMGEDARAVLASLDLAQNELGVSLQFGFQVNKISLLAEWRDAVTDVYDLPADSGIKSRNFRVGLTYDF